MEMILLLMTVIYSYFSIMKLTIFMTFIVYTFAWIIIQEYVYTDILNIQITHRVINYFSLREKKLLWQAQSWRQYLNCDSIIHIDDRGV